MDTQVLNVRYYKAGYEIRTEQVAMQDEKPVTMKSAYTPEGHYIGSSRWAYRLIVKRGIKPEPRTPASPESNGGRGRTCSIGFCEHEQKWYGWSHRAICGFEIGDSVSSDDHLCSHSGWTAEYLIEHPEEDLSLPVGWSAKTLNDCKLMAIAYAAAVS